MKKIIIFLSIIIVLFVAVAVLTKMQTEDKVSEKNPYGKKELRAETVAQLDDPNYQNIILPNELEKKLADQEDATVYFYSPTCIHCQKTTPILAPLAKDLGVNMYKFNLLEFEDGWDQYQITGTPTLIQFKNGKETNRISGFNEKEVFDKWLKENSL